MGGLEAVNPHCHRQDWMPHLGAAYQKIQMNDAGQNEDFAKQFS